MAFQSEIMSLAHMTTVCPIYRTKTHYFNRATYPLASRNVQRSLWTCFSPLIHISNNSDWYSGWKWKSISCGCLNCVKRRNAARHRPTFIYFVSSSFLNFRFFTCFSVLFVRFRSATCTHANVDDHFILSTVTILYFAFDRYFSLLLTIHTAHGTTVYVDVQHSRTH